MRKREELAPTSDGCLAKAGEQEMLFVLLSRDAAAPDTILWWCHRRINLGLNKSNDPQIREAMECAKTMRLEKDQYKKRPVVKIPFDTFKNPTCRGDVRLGNACGVCEKCVWLRGQGVEI